MSWALIALLSVAGYLAMTVFTTRMLVLEDYYEHRDKAIKGKWELSQEQLKNNISAALFWPVFLPLWFCMCAIPRGMNRLTGSASGSSLLTRPPRSIRREIELKQRESAVKERERRIEKMERETGVAA